MSGSEAAHLRLYATRAYYYTSTTGDAQRITGVRQALWDLGFHPEVFHRKKSGEKAKGVDIALTKDVLSHAYLDNYDAAVLIAGDGDYVPLLSEVKRLGKLAFGSFFTSHGTNPDFRLACDTFFPLDDAFRGAWT